MSIGTELGEADGLTIKQSSKFGSSVPRVKGVVVATLEYVVGPVVGIPHSSSGRYESVMS